MMRRMELEPFTSPFDLLQEMTRWFEGGSQMTKAPVDVYETEDALVAELAVPGFAKDEIEIALEGGVLTVRGEHKAQSERTDDNRRYYLQEVSRQSFVRSFTLPVEVDTQQVRAELDNGLLKIWLPKAAQAKPRRIAVQVNS